MQTSVTTARAGGPPRRSTWKTTRSIRAKRCPRRATPAFPLGFWKRWGATNQGGAWDLGAAFEYGSYSTTYINFAPGAAADFSAEFSGMTRLTPRLRYALVTSPRFGFQLSGAAGFQSEAYSQTQSSAAAATADFSTASSARFRVAASATWRALPGTIAVRPEAQLEVFQVRRSRFFVGDTGVDAPTVEELNSLNTSGRAYVDLETLAFAGLVPHAFVGAQLLSFSGSESSSVFVPSAGIGLANSWF